jgi:tetratricopeptide (TPR) repeat protein
LYPLAVLALALGFCTGCPAPGATDDQKNPYFISGREKVRHADYAGAIQAFNKAVEVNPRSSPAHYALGCLYEERGADPAAAIFHYERYLKLSPAAENAPMIRERINTCKLELAKSSFLTLGGQPVQREKEIKAEIDRLLAENTQLRHQLSTLGHVVRPPTATNPPGPVKIVPPAATNRVATPAPPAAAARTHKIASGDTPANLARKYGVKVESLMAANPGLDPKKLKIGQSLNIPAR